MRNTSIIFFVLVMWILIIVGGGILVNVLGPISISGQGELNYIISSGLKTIIAIILVIMWVIILLKLKNWIFKKQIDI